MMAVTRLLNSALGYRPKSNEDDPSAALFLTPRAAERAGHDYIARAGLTGQARVFVNMVLESGCHRGWRAHVKPDGKAGFDLTTYTTGDGY